MGAQQGSHARALFLAWFSEVLCQRFLEGARAFRGERVLRNGALKAGDSLIKDSFRKCPSKLCVSYFYDVPFVVDTFSIGLLHAPTNENPTGVHTRSVLSSWHHHTISWKTVVSVVLKLNPAIYSDSHLCVLPRKFADTAPFGVPPPLSYKALPGNASLHNGN